MSELDGDEVTAIVRARTFDREYQQHPSESDRPEIAWYVDELSDHEWTTLVVEFACAHIEHAFGKVCPRLFKFQSVAFSDIPM